MTIALNFRTAPKPCLIRQDTRLPVWHVPFARLEAQAIRVLVQAGTRLYLSLPPARKAAAGRPQHGGNASLP